MNELADTHEGRLSRAVLWSTLGRDRAL